MNIDKLNNFGFYLIVGIEVFFIYKYAKYWMQILSILKEEDGEGSMFSQKSLKDTALRGNLIRGYGMIFSNMSASARILFSSKIENPKIAVLAKRLRRTVFLAILTPLIIIFVLIFIAALMQ